MRLALVLILGFLISGCGVLIGTVKPIDEKSENYSVMDLSRKNPDWQKIASQSDDQHDNESTDLAYQAKSTAAIISLNSACRARVENETKDLRQLTDLLLLGISDISLREEKPLMIDGIPALETTVLGKMSKKQMKIRTVVVKKSKCLYDLMYISRPDSFALQENDFAQFKASLKLKDN
jgi:hypothetical protein